MIESVIEAEFDVSVDKIWNIVTNNQDYSWRTDLKKVEIFDHSKFMEIDKKGICSTLTITKKEANSAYEFDIQNKNLSGTWSGIFTPISANKSKLIITEKITFTGGFAGFLAKITNAVKKLQNAYLADLKTATTTAKEVK